MRAILIGAALLASAGAAAAHGHGGAGHGEGGHGGGRGGQVHAFAPSVGEVSRIEARGGSFVPLGGRSDGAWGFAHGRGFAGGHGFPDGRVARREGGYGYGYGPYGFGGYGYTDAGDEGGGGYGPGAFGPQQPYGDSFAESLRGGPGAPPFGLYNHSGQGAYAYGYNGFAETPALPTIPTYASYAYAGAPRVSPEPMAYAGPPPCGC